MLLYDGKTSVQPPELVVLSWSKQEEMVEVRDAIYERELPFAPLSKRRLHETGDFTFRSVTEECIMFKLQDDIKAQLWSCARSETIMG